MIAAADLAREDVNKATRVLQNAYVVNDLHEAIDRWATSLGLGPFFILENATLETLHRGVPATVELSVAMAQAGPVNIELIQQLNDAPSAYRDAYAPGEEGFHHVCMLVDDYEGELRRYSQLGCPLALEADLGAYRIVYVDTRARLGCMVELVEDVAAIRELYRRVREGAEHWDGSRLLRALHGDD